MKDLSPELLARVADYFRILSEPTRLQLLNLLREGEHNVGELAGRTGFTPANVSRHMAQLMAQGMVSREARGTAVYYRIANATVYELCDLVCGAIASHQEKQARGAAALRSGAARSRAR
ncbi:MULTISPECIES: metalloregulator ArsR/SmtB family transcription factor [Ramlibacter]|uniref:Winged helix-turn-helix transcriptional regulator n=1 Tax=Ramlibacter aquaticus TaxID=2780094 RepID=A0ABR9SKC2_9BURK|nr:MULTISPECIES: metalloregulator ArsR/SmtB family transcription factor [Ramlibacter]MBE7942806.1 winged helix-turn-helix transcriptional regulator [Ramlibacter aquaticus]